MSSLFYSILPVYLNNIIKACINSIMKDLISICIGVKSMNLMLDISARGEEEEVLSGSVHGIKHIILYPYT
jgi:hypothetical protein